MLEVNVTSVIPAAIDRVWAVIRDFNAMPAWHPLIAASRIETGAPSDQVGCVRNFTLTDGARIREKLLALSDLDRSFAYGILEADVPLRDYTAGISLKAVTDGEATFGHWWAKFNAPAGQEADLLRMVEQDVFRAGFEALKKRYL
ncbi:MAG: SRPBCC family protein [Rhodospirillales bacterium]|nr:SRPBCC family protein [Rhodospirillales bacterium]